MSESYEFMTCEQSWHFDVCAEIQFKVPKADTAGMLEAKERVLAFVEKTSWEYLERLKNAQHPIECRSELRRVAGGKNCNQATINAAVEHMVTFDGTLHTSNASANVRAQNAQLKGELAVAILAQKKAARTMAAAMLKAGTPEAGIIPIIEASFPDEDPQAVIDAAKLPE